MVTKQGYCGHKRPSDVQVHVVLNHISCQIDIQSPLKNMFGRHMKEAVLEVLKSENIQHIKVELQDDGALDFVIRARVRTAIRRAKKK